MTFLPISLWLKKSYRDLKYLKQKSYYNFLSLSVPRVQQQAVTTEGMADPSQVPLLLHPRGSAGPGRAGEGPQGRRHQAAQGADYRAPDTEAPRHNPRQQLPGR